jgi:hypothetical protein
MLKGAQKDLTESELLHIFLDFFVKSTFLSIVTTKNKEVRCAHRHLSDKRRPSYASKRYFTVTSYGLLRLLKGPSAWHGLLMTCPALGV